MKWLWVIVVFLAACGSAVTSGTPTATEPPAPTPSPEYDFIADLTVGQCFDPLRDKDDGIILAAELKSCDEAHLAEVTGQLELADAAGAPYPGDDEAAGASDEVCRSAFRDYVGIEYDSSRLQAEYSYPGPKSFSGGDRAVTCFVIGTEVGPLTRSVQGTRQ